MVPKILSDCIKAVESRGMSSCGIYRVSGHSTEILELKEKYDEGEHQRSRVHAQSVGLAYGTQYINGWLIIGLTMLARGV